MSEESQEETPERAPEASQEQPTPPWGDEFDAERAWKALQKANREAKTLRDRQLTDEQRQKLAQYDALEQASKSELDRAREESVRWQTEADKWRVQTVSSRIEALAAPDFAFPGDAASKLEPQQYLDLNGNIDEARIKADLAELLVERPIWRRQNAEDPKPRTPLPNPDQGSGGGARAAVDPRQEFAALLTKGLNQ